MSKILIFYGSRTEFDKFIPRDNKRTLTDLVMEIDTDTRNFTVEIPGHEIKSKSKPKVKNFIAGSDEYAGVREHVILNFADFLAKIDFENLYLQNPPLSISLQIKRLYPHIEIKKQTYKVISRDDILMINNTYQNRIKGQEAVKLALLKALFPLTTRIRTKPVVILFYGDTGLGKTETAQLISDVVNEKLFRKQFSMFQNNQFATYVFGGAHYERSFAKELLDRESNIILLDEFDKSNNTFHSAFYQLFDEGIYEDQNYSLELMRSIIICTSNYKSVDDIKEHLGKAIFSRFDAVIKFSDLTIEAKEEIAILQYNEKVSQYTDEEKKVIEVTNIKERLISACTQCTNAREISHLIEDTLSLVLIQDLLQKNSGSDNS
ncbi:AAA family ATPase [Clostridium thermopalmarium]|uniref:ATP-dependent Clp protease ATP-binding subunit ClpE n=1 Tax=Clostridium thermopalmarium DSM 5974 TaxID=1121340 RepID=A0A2T0AZW2_9CLOT|nr:AAA family ATPase [Clostridium thermopalmarium]PRR76608.1 ATP-dependent Clp protease ATP-binding subunit ClpE [Clostridium thermopalmarium DSM 5974]PVZ28279.1 Cdc48 subfamily AAA family protein [Clostridium thermopalmarium DSM 5974]